MEQPNDLAQFLQVLSDATATAIHEQQPTYPGEADVPIDQASRHQDSHKQLLATKWMQSVTLNKMEASEGLYARKGRFTATEQNAIQTAVDNFCIQQGLTHEQISEMVSVNRGQRQNKSRQFWHVVATAVPSRPIRSVYLYICRKYHPLRYQGIWQPPEDSALIEAVKTYGSNKWVKISQSVGREASDCRDRYRNHIMNRDAHKTGRWTKHEEDLLTEIMQKFIDSQVEAVYDAKFWDQVSHAMGGMRTKQQCKEKWNNCLRQTVANNGMSPQWNPWDTYVLLHKLNSLKVLDESEINWQTLPDPLWSVWAARTLQRQWKKLKQSVEDYNERGYQDILNTLLERVPSPPIAYLKQGQAQEPRISCIEDKM